MADRDEFADVAAEIIGEVNDRVVLDVGARADGDFVDVAAEGGVVPDTGFFVDRDAADHMGAGGDEGAFVDLGVKGREGFDGHGVCRIRLCCVRRLW